MRLDLRLPRLSAAMEEGILVEWHKEEGEEIAYGDELCHIVVEEVSRLRRSLSARMAVRRKSRGKSRYRTLEGVTVRFRLVSAEVGTLTRVVAPAGTSVKEGDVLAFLESGSQDGVGGDSHAATARVVVDLVGPSAVDSSL